MPTNLYLGDNAANTTLTGASDGALTVQSGAFGAKVNALQIDAVGNATVAGNLTSVGNVTAPGFQGRLTAGGSLTLGTAQATTSGTFIDFTGIPSWVKRITVMFNGVSTNGTSNVQVQLGAGSIITSGYVGSGLRIQGSTATTFSSFTSGFAIATINSSTDTQNGSIVLNTLGSNIWTCNGGIYSAGYVATHQTVGLLAIGGTLDRLRLTTVNGTDLFDAGSVNIMYEG